MKRKQLLKSLLGASATIGSLLFLPKTEATPPVPSLTIDKYALKGAYKVKVELDSSEAVAIYSDGEILARSSLDHANVFQKAVDEGGKILVKPGKYYFKSSVTFTKHGTKLIAESEDEVEFVQQADVDLFVISDNIERCALGGFKITSEITPSSGSGVVVRGSRNFLFDIEVEKTYRGVVLYGDSTPIYCYYNTLMNVYVHHCIEDGFWMNKAEPGYCNSTLFLNCISRWNGGNGFTLTRYNRVIGGESSYNTGKSFDVEEVANVIFAFAEGNDGGDVIRYPIPHPCILASNPQFLLIDPRYDRYVKLSLVGFYNYATLEVSGTQIMKFYTDRTKTPYDIEFEDATKGIILVDRTTGTKYRLYIDNGTLSIEAIA